MSRAGACGCSSGRRIIDAVSIAAGLWISASQPAEAGCDVDTQCKGDRICDAGVCVSPSASAPVTCAVDVDCPNELTCERGTCTERPIDAARPTAIVAPSERPSAPLDGPPQGETPPQAPPKQSGSYVGAVLFLVPLAGAPLVGFNADLSLAGATTPGALTIGLSFGYGDQRFDVGGMQSQTDFLDAQAWVGYRYAFSSSVTGRAKIGGIMYSAKTTVGGNSTGPEAGGGLVTGTDLVLGGFVIGADLWISGSTDVCFRVGYEH